MADRIDLELLECFVVEASDALVQWEKVCLSLSAENTSESLNAIFRVAHNLKGSSRSIGLTEFGAFVHEVEDYIGELKSHPEKVNEVVVRRLLQVQSFIVDWLSTLSQDQSYQPDTKPVLQLLTAASEATESQASVRTAQQSEGDELKNKKSQGAARQETATKSASANETIRVRSQKLDQLIQVIGELGIQQAIVSHCVKSNKTNSADFLKALNMVTKMSKEIQAQSIALRMMELQGLFQRLERTGRELAGELNKKIEFIVEGADLELDKVVIETITEPLIHIIRNAIDHGVENREERLKTTKNELAQVKISARKDTDSVFITIQDDGKGIDRNKVLKKAVEKGLVSADAQLSPQECLQLIFEPGFSTAEKITAVSGRGVGMDVVRKAVESVRGSVEILSEVGSGSSFVIMIPTSMNIIDAVVVEIASEKYVVPLNNIIEIIDLNSNEITPHKDENMQVLKLRHQVMPLENLAAYLSLQNAKESSNHLQLLKGNIRSTEANLAPQRPAIVSGSARGLVAFQVDRVLGQQRVIVKPLMGCAQYPEQVSGTTVLSDGKPGFILSLSALADEITKAYKQSELKMVSH